MNKGRFLCRAVPCRAVPCRAMPCHAVPCHAVPCHAELSEISYMQRGTTLMKLIHQLVRHGSTESNHMARDAWLGRPSATYKTNSRAAPRLAILAHAYNQGKQVTLKRIWNGGWQKFELYDLSQNVAFGKAGKRAYSYEGNLGTDIRVVKIKAFFSYGIFLIGMSGSTLNSCVFCLL